MADDADHSDLIKQSVSSGGNVMKRTVYVGGLHDDVGRDILEGAFLPFGEIKQVEMPTEKNSSKHRGFGFVEFREEEDAAAAIDNMNLSELFGRTLRVNLARAPNSKAETRTTPIWADDFFHKKKLKEQGMEPGEGL